MTRLVYQSQTHPSHDRVRDGIQDLGYKMSIDGRLCFRLSMYVSGLFKAVKCIRHGLGRVGGVRNPHEVCLLIGAMIRFPISRILANVRGSYQSIRTTCHPLPLVHFISPIFDN